MKRTIITIDAEKCNGCGLCVDACHEGAIELVDGRARLVSDEYCDGLGDCLPACPTGAITFEEREALAYDEAAVQRRLAAQKGGHSCSGGGQGCPGRAEKSVGGGCQGDCHSETAGSAVKSELRQWPVQLALVNPGAGYLAGADLLIAADCTAYAYGNIHRDFMQGRVTLIGCPKLDQYAYREKLAAIFGQNDIKSITLLRMAVPCCGGLVAIVRQALELSGSTAPLEVVTVTTEGEIRGS